MSYKDEKGQCGHKLRVPKMAYDITELYCYLDGDHEGTHISHWDLYQWETGDPNDIPGPTIYAEED